MKYLVLGTTVLASPVACTPNEAETTPPAPHANTHNEAETTPPAPHADTHLESAERLCPFPDLHPGYLPTGVGEDKHPQRDSYTAEGKNESSFAILIWSSGSAKELTTYVHLMNSTERPIKGGTRVDVVINGVPGILGDYDAQSKGMVVNWLKGKPCGTLELALSDPSLQPSELARELRKIARSLK